jgi:CheY-like chemotaxis protein
MEQRPRISEVCENLNQRPVARRSLEKQHCMDLEKYCAYNQTREHLLASEVDVGDFSVASLKDRIPALATNYGAGLWLIPFRGISVMSEQTPIDLIYLDAHSIVIDVVVSFPIFCISKASPLAASVLALPGNTIDSAQIRRGDQLLLCPASEFNRRLLQLPRSSSNVETAQGADSGKVEPVCGGSGSRLQSDDGSGESRLNQNAPPLDSCPTRQSRGDFWKVRKNGDIMPTKNWLQRWWSPDVPEPRKAPRESFPGLGAHFFTGGTPVEHEVRDISLTGLYVVTEERWFPGTQVRMTLRDSGDPAVENSITTNTSVIRWGNDGVGLRFVVEDEKGMRRDRTYRGSGIDKNELNRFLQLAGNGKRNSETGNTASRNYVARDSADTDGQKLPLSTGLQPVHDGRGDNSSLVGVSTGPVMTKVSGQPTDRFGDPGQSYAASARSSNRAVLKASPLEREEATSGHADQGFDNLFIGPVNSSLLIDSLKDLPRPVSVAGASPLMNWSNRSALQLPVVVPSTSSRQRPRILLIDDEYLDIAFVTGSLEDDYEMIFATDGATALETAGRTMPDLILLDVMMPGIDGFEVCRQLKADNRTKEIPVIFITGLSEAASETKGLKMGAVDYISKPFHSAPLRARVNKHLNLKRGIGRLDPVDRNRWCEGVRGPLSL